MNQLPAPSSFASGEYRALQVFDHIPPGCKGVLVTNDRFAPHLRCGEFAVVDTADKIEQIGEIYLLRNDIGNGKITWTFVQLVKGRPNSDRPRFAYGKPELWGTAANMVDGPMHPEYWPDLCGGRVVGVVEFLRADGFRV